MAGVMKLLPFILHGLLVPAYRPESLLNVAHILKGDGDEPGNEGEAKDEKPEPPKEAIKNGKDAKDPEEKPKDCFWHLKQAKNWIVEFPDLDLLQKQMEDKVRVQSPQADNEDTWGELVKIDGKFIQLYLGAWVFFNQSSKGPDCEDIKNEDIRLSSSVECKETGSRVNPAQAKSRDGMNGYLLKTSNFTVVLQRSEQAGDSVVIGDWTFEAGDFSISKKEDGRLEIQQKMWNHTVAYNGTVTGPEDKTKYTAQMEGLDSECKTFKVEKCPENMCKSDGSTCKADKNKGHKVELIVDLQKPNDLTRIVDGKREYDAVKRSFIPQEADADAFVCVKVNDTWMPIRGMSYKQLSSNSQKVKDAEDSKGMKVFDGKNLGKEWIQEEHIMLDGLFIKDGHRPPWTKSIKATVHWKKAQICPERFPLCYEDGDCVAQDCKNGCEWSRSPTVDNKDEEYNYIAGMDTFGTACDTDNEVLRNSASCLSFLAVVATFLYQIL